MAMFINTGILTGIKGVEIDNTGTSIIVDGKVLGVKIGNNDSNLLVPADVIYPALGATCTTNRQAGAVTIKIGLKTFQIRENNYDI